MYSTLCSTDSDSLRTPAGRGGGLHALAVAPRAEIASSLSLREGAPRPAGGHTRLVTVPAVSCRSQA